MTVILVNAEAGVIPLPDDTTHCHCTSPPYWKQRNYFSKEDEEGDTQRRYWPEVTYRPAPGLAAVTVPAGTFALGMEPTPELFVAHLVLVYREVFRVTRSDSAGWCVIGDCFWDSNRRRATRTVRALNQGEEDGQLVGIPAMLMKALQADGWTVRNDCVWHKVAPMPESVAGTRWTRCRVKFGGKWQDAKHFNQDDGHSGHISNRLGPQWQDCPGCPRCEAHGGYVLRRGSWRHTRAHETVLHLTKGMGYWSDQEAVREASTGHGGVHPFGKQDNMDRNDNGRCKDQDLMPSRNPRSVLTPKPSSYSGKHYATYPVGLIRPLIKSSCPTKCCPACGSGWAPRIEKPDMSQRPTRSDEAKYPTNGSQYSDDGGGTSKSAGQAYQEWRNANPDQVIDYLPTCACARKLAEQQTGDGPQTGAEWLRRLAEAAEQLAPVPGIVLDPFFGSGTTGIVARELDVDCIGLDLSYDYLKDQARARLELDAWDAWHQGRDGDVAGDDLEGLPLFEGVR